MITIPNKDFKSSNITLQQIINSTTKVKMLRVCKKFDLYVSPNLRKDETSRRIAMEVMDNPLRFSADSAKPNSRYSTSLCEEATIPMWCASNARPLTSSRNTISLSLIATMKRTNGTCSCLRNSASPLLRASHSS